MYVPSSFLAALSGSLRHPKPRGPVVSREIGRGGDRQRAVGVANNPVTDVRPRWAVDETDAGFVFSDQNGRARARVSFGEQGGQSAAGNLLTPEEARQIPVNVGK